MIHLLRSSVERQEKNLVSWAVTTWKQYCLDSMLGWMGRTVTFPQIDRSTLSCGMNHNPSQ